MSSNTWRNRGYLPHFDGSNVIQSITFRLADSLPQETLLRIEKDLERIPDEDKDANRQRRIEGWLAAGMGSCALRHPRLAKVMQEALLHSDGERYRLLAWCIMPNHVHVLIEPSVALAKIVQSWKSFTGRWAKMHASELGLEIGNGPFWMREYWDRYIRDEGHFKLAVQYIHRNPVAAKLCSTPESWTWSSAAMKPSTELDPVLE